MDPWLHDLEAPEVLEGLGAELKFDQEMQEEFMVALVLLGSPGSSRCGEEWGGALENLGCLLEFLHFLQRLLHRPRDPILLDSNPH